MLTADFLASDYSGMELLIALYRLFLPIQEKSRDKSLKTSIQPEKGPISPRKPAVSGAVRPFYIPRKTGFGDRRKEVRHAAHAKVSQGRVGILP